MSIPVWSIVALISEIGIAACVFSIIWYAYEHGKFMERFAIGVVVYEIVFNLAYLASQELRGAASAPLNPYTTPLSIFHGVFPLIMSVVLVAFFIAAWRRYSAGENFFRRYEDLTIAFVIAWSLSLLSGILLFLELYIV